MGPRTRIDSIVLPYYSPAMGYLSVRNVPDRLERLIRSEARRRGTTKSAIVIEYLERGARDFPPPERPSLREWAGKLHRQDLEAILETSTRHRSIDKELWS